MSARFNPEDATGQVVRRSLPLTSVLALCLALPGAVQAQAKEAPGEPAVDAPAATAPNLAPLKLPKGKRASAPAPIPAAGVSMLTMPAKVDLQSAQQQEMVLSAPIERIAIADPSVADALMLKPKGDKPGFGSLLLFGKRSGSTNLLVWQRGRSQAHSIELVVDADDLKGTGLRATGSVLAGTAPNMVAHAQASEMIRQNQTVNGGKVLIDQSTVATGGTVQVDVKVVELGKSALKQVGTSFSFVNGKYFFDSLLGPVTSPLQGAFNLVGQISSSTNLSIRLLQSNGLARVLAEPTLVAQSGHSASFLAGGEIPVPVPQGLGSVGIEYKQFGIGLAVTPTVLGPNRIALKVAPQASDLDYTNAVTINGSAVPALRTRRADTTVELGDGESFVIGGLISKNTISNVDKVPLLGDLPIIGAFFKNLSYRSEEKELVIIVTPHLVKPLAREARLTPLPGAGTDVANPAVWTPYLLGGDADALPGFSK